MVSIINVYLNSQTMRSFCIISRLSFIVFILLMCSCKNWLDIEPIDKVQEDKLFRTQEGFFKALNGIYLDLASTSLYGKELSCGFTDVLAQLYAVNPQQISGVNHPYRFHSTYSYKEKEVKATLEDVWQKAYFLIANCNNLIEKAESRKEIFTRNHYEIVTGEAYALRAMLHFDLFRLWGPVYNKMTGENADRKCIPYYHETTQLPEVLQSASQIADFILADLEKAESLLQSDWEADIAGENRRLRMNLFAVEGIKARFYLYIGQKQKAYETVYPFVGEQVKYREFMADYFPFVEQKYIINENPDRVFYSEILFGIQNSQRNALYENMFEYLLEVQTFMAPRISTIEGLFAGRMEDYRNKQWRENPGNAKDVEFVKFQRITDNNLPVRTNTQSIIRKSELYLIAAECAVDAAEKVWYLDRLSIGRGFQSGFVTGEEDLDQWIRNEYKREFYGEGQYFFFLKRHQVQQLQNEYDSQIVYTMGEAQYILPLPDSEINFR